MFWTFILGIIAGWAAPLAEERLKQPLQQALSGETMPPVELRAVSLTVCLLVAAIIALIVGSGHALPLMIGALLGVMGPRLYDRFRAMRAPDYDS